MAELLKKLEAAICEPEMPREIVQRAYAVEVDGETWGFVTNGVVAVFVRGAGGDPLHDVPPMLPKLARQSDAEGWAGVDMGVFREWVGPYEEPQGTPPVECKECDGNGEVECECHCGHEHETTCDTCKGTGYSVPPQDAEPRRGRIGHVLLDRNKLAQALVLLPGEKAQLATNAYQSDKPLFERFTQVFLRGDGWRLVLGGLREDEPIPDVPRWEPATAEVPS